MAGFGWTEVKKNQAGMSGSMTVFFCLSLLLVTAIICTCLESARTAGARFVAQVATESALQSVFAEYHEILWDEYHVFFHHEDEPLTDEVEEYLSYYQDPAKNLYGITSYTDLWELSVDEISVTETKTALSDGGRLFLEQAVEYEKYQLSATLLEELLGQTELLGEINQIRDFAAEVSECFEYIQQISVHYQEVRDCVGVMLQLGQQAKELFSKTEEKVDLETLYDTVSTLVRQVDRVGEAAATYLKEAESIDRLLGKWAAKYGDSEETVYGQQIGQLREFTVNGLFGIAVEVVEGKSNEVNGQLQAVLTVVGELLETQRTEQEENAAREMAVNAVEFGLLVMEELDGRLDEPLRTGNEPNSDISAEEENKREQEGHALLETVKQWKNMAVLSLVMGEEGVQTSSDRFTVPEQLPSFTVKDSLKNVTAAEKGLFVFYVTDTFTNVLSEEQMNFAYQQEYILFGKDDSRSNLTAMAGSLLAIREGLNLAYLLTNPQMMSVAESIAVALVGATGIYPLVLLTQFVILAAWAFAESVADVRGLFAGNAVELWKTQAAWKTSLGGWLKSSEEEKFVTEGISFDFRFTYTDYMRAFLLAKDTQTLCLRSMDIIQHEVCGDQGEFRMADCYGAAELLVRFSAPVRLISLPLAGGIGGANHQMEVVSSYIYK